MSCITTTALRKDGRDDNIPASYCPICTFVFYGTQMATFLEVIGAILMKSRHSILIVVVLSTLCVLPCSIQLGLADSLFDEIRIKAGQGQAEAQYQLGRMYDNGQGVTQDYKEAAKWYRMAAEQGNSMAQNSIGSITHNPSCHL